MGTKCSKPSCDGFAKPPSGCTSTVRPNLHRDGVMAPPPGSVVRDGKLKTPSRRLCIGNPFNSRSSNETQKTKNAPESGLRVPTGFRGVLRSGWVSPGDGTPAAIHPKPPAPRISPRNPTKPTNINVTLNEAMTRNESSQSIDQNCNHKPRLLESVNEGNGKERKNTEAFGETVIVESKLCVPQKVNVRFTQIPTSIPVVTRLQSPQKLDFNCNRVRKSNAATRTDRFYAKFSPNSTGRASTEENLGHYDPKYVPWIGENMRDKRCIVSETPDSDITPKRDNTSVLQNGSVNKASSWECHRKPQRSKIPPSRGCNSLSSLKPSLECSDSQPTAWRYLPKGASSPKSTPVETTGSLKKKRPRYVAVTDPATKSFKLRPLAFPSKERVADLSPVRSMSGESLSSISIVGSTSEDGSRDDDPREDELSRVFEKDLETAFKKSLQKPRKDDVDAILDGGLDDFLIDDEISDQPDLLANTQTVLAVTPGDIPTVDDGPSSYLSVGQLTFSTMGSDPAMLADLSGESSIEELREKLRQTGESAGHYMSLFASNDTNRPLSDEFVPALGKK
ncbi:unnamed protein product [Notodromas monacha]|uniref:Uncharacterized protein n=1 Tax=Notodromas monacha TaxID=399045 RepID=A0A7R9BN28_9CRUS|nr:unnamed protein product [Notodromas monacha]CAG0918213.1 unnamed protein product [Notodromas monacha]